VRAAIYCRISQDREGRELGVARQSADCRKLCTDRGWDVAREFTENDISAFSGKPRLQYIAMMAALAAGEFDAIVSYSPTRLHRSPKELESFIDVVEAQHAAVATCMAGDYDLSTATGRMTARIHGAVARHESEQASERIKRKDLEIAMAGGAHGGPRPFGYSADHVNLDEHEAACIREVAENIIGGAGLLSQCRLLNNRGDLTARGKQWQTTVLRRLLLSPRVIGQREHITTGLHDAQWPAIIDQTTQTRLRALLISRPYRVGTVAPGRYLLSSLMTCAVCKATLVHFKGWGANKEAYLCRNGCVSINAVGAEAWITEQVLVRANEPLVYTEHDGDVGEDIAAEIADHHQTLRDLGAGIASGALSVEMAQAAASGIEVRIRDAEQRLANTIAAVPTIPEIVRGGNVDFVTGLPFTLRDIWEDDTISKQGNLIPGWDVTERRGYISHFIEKVTVSRSKKGAPRRFSSNRMQITWRQGIKNTSSL
jgi:site-specific DNA recombinase